MARDLHVVAGLEKEKNKGLSKTAYSHQLDILSSYKVVLCGKNYAERARALGKKHGVCSGSTDL